MKTYLPQPDGDWGIVFTGDTDEAGRAVLVYLAFGVRHPRHPWEASVYQGWVDATCSRPFFFDVSPLVKRMANQN